MTERKTALSIEEAADYTGIGRNTLRKLVEWKKLPVLKVGRKGSDAELDIDIYSYRKINGRSIK